MSLPLNTNQKKEKMKKATIKETGEKINVYQLSGGKYYDYDAMGENQPPTSKLGKKEFDKKELQF